MRQDALSLSLSLSPPLFLLALRLVFSISEALGRVEDSGLCESLAGCQDMRYVSAPE